MPDGLQQVSFTSPYAADEEDVLRQQRLADALRAHAMQPMGGTEFAPGGVAIRRSPFEGAAKLSQAWNASAAEEGARQRQEQLSKRYTDDLTHALAAAQEASQPHLEATNTASEGTGSFDMSGTAGPAQRMVPGNMEAVINALNTHPATQQLALSQFAQNLQQQRLAATLAQYGYGPQSAAPAASGAGAIGGATPTAGVAPTGSLAVSGSGGAGAVPPGVSPLAMALALQKGDPAELAKMIQEAGKPMTTRFGVFGADPNRPGFVRPIGGASPPGALNYQFDAAGNPSLGLMPGQAQGVAALKSAEASGAQPYQTGMTKVPVYLPGGDQTEVNLNPVQMEAYNRTGALPPEIAASIPGYQPPAPGAGSAPAPASPQAAQGTGPWASKGEMKFSDLSPQEQAAARLLNAGGRGSITMPNAQTPAARPVAGRTQTQTEQIRQAGQTAANTEAGRAFIDEMRQNYAKLRDVPATLANMARAKELAAGEAATFMGPFGESKLAITKFLRSNVPGMGNLNTEGVTNAEQLQSTLFNQVMDNLKKMDASPSQYQQQVMQEAFGTLRTDPQSVPKILDVFSDILRNRVAIHNETVGSAEERGTVFPYDVKVKLQGAGGAPVKFSDAEKERRYQEWKRAQGQ